MAATPVPARFDFFARTENRMFGNESDFKKKIKIEKIPITIKKRYEYNPKKNRKKKIIYT